MENVDIFKEMDATEIERILYYFDKLKSFFDTHDDYIQHINRKIKTGKIDIKPINPQEMWAINDLLKYAKQADFNHLVAFEDVKDAKDIYQELNFLSREGRFVSSIFRKYKQKTAKSILEDTTEIMDAYRLLAKQYPQDEKIQADLKRLETEFNKLQTSSDFNVNVLHVLNEIVK